MLYVFYRILSFLSYPLLKGWVSYRVSKGKEEPLRVEERYGKASKQRPTGKLFWFHGASIGETLSFMPVLSFFEKNYPSYSFLVTSGTRASSELLTKKLSSRCIHQYMPLDHPLFVGRFLEHWKPDACFWTESDFWPNLIIKGSRACPFFLLNGRFSEKSSKRWGLFSSFILRILKCFSVVFPQSFSDFKRFKRLGVSHLKMAGNLKYEGEKLEVSSEKIHTLRKELGRRPLWIASNTHAGEERIVLEVYQKLKKAIGENPLLILIPRHKNRVGVLETMLNSYNFSHVKRSEDKKISPRTNVLLVDTLGELGVFYSLSHFVFMGGSLLPGIGGHNILEPTRLGALPVFGPYMENNKEMAELLIKNKAALQVKSQAHLEKTINHLLTDVKNTKKQSLNAVQILKSINILDPIICEVKKYLHD